MIKCTGNNGNGCFMDSCAHNCDCEGLKEFGEELKNKKMKKVASVLWGDDHYEDTLEEMIEHMIDEGLTKEEIVGIEVEFCEEANVYSDEDYLKIQDIIYAECEIYDDYFFQKKREEVMKLVESFKYHNPFQKYIITEEDFENSL